MFSSTHSLQCSTSIRLLLMTGLLLLNFISSASAQVPNKNIKQMPVTKIVPDNVLKNGNKITGGWYEYANDGSWRRVEFTLDALTGRAVISDGKSGSKLPDVTRFSASGRPGFKGQNASFQELRNFTDTSPVIGDKSNRTSLIPGDVAKRIHELGGDTKLMQQLLDIKRISELGGALDAARNVGAGGGLTNGFPGTGTKGRDGKWSDPRAGVGRDGRASDGQLERVTIQDGDTTESTTYRIRNDDGSSTEVRESRDRYTGDRTTRTTEYDSAGRGTGGHSDTRWANGDRTSGTFTYNYSTDELYYNNVTVHRDGTVSQDKGRTPGRPINQRNTPPETGASGRGFDEAWLARSIPWLMDAYYADWKRESDLVKSGGRISQPARGESSTIIVNESPNIGASAVVNCGDSNTTPCIRVGRVTVNPRDVFGKISQPGRGVPTGPIDGKEQPKPIPVPEPKP